MRSRRPSAEDIASRASRLVAQHIGRAAVIAGPRVVDGRWEVPVYIGAEGRWAELVRLRFDALGRVSAVPWPEVYERAARLLAADDAMRQLIPDAPEPSVAAEAAALGDFDPITGLPSLALWEARLAREVARWHRFREPFCAAWISIDPGPAVAALGHRERAALWRLAARRLWATVRSEDLLAAGPLLEFALVLVGDAASARRACQRLAECLRKPFRLYEAGPSLRVRVRLGLAEMGDGLTAAALAAAARRAASPAADRAAA